MFLPPVCPHLCETIRSYPEPGAHFPKVSQIVKLKALRVSYSDIFCFTTIYHGKTGIFYNLAQKQYYLCVVIYFSLFAACYFLQPLSVSSHHQQL